MTNPNEYDPLADSDKAPSITWKDLPVGTVQTLDVSEPCGAPIHYKDYDTQELQYWQPKGRPSSVPTDKPVQQMILNGLDKDGEPAALFVKIRGEQLFYKLAEAQKAIGHRIGAGPEVDRIMIRLDGRENAEGRKQNQFSVKITSAGPRKTAPAPDPMAGDPWSSTPAAPTGGAGFGDDEPPF